MGANASKVWVVVANATVARLFKGSEDGRGVVEFETLAHPEGRMAGRELKSDAPGVAFKASGAGWHTAGPDTELKQQELRSFALEIARRLDDARTRGECAALALIAAPALLGELRAKLSTQTGGIVGYTLDKNLVHATPAELMAALPPRFVARSAGA